ncbi:efflux RND transporter periplasmic adaptor subunit [Paraherbaspirillum soli]|uniref:Efflux RND transporter periplasmic adaptor subunit n=1 Tax=Paraherbaspirillum soli TaxID=631222 RepID=A0ABW0M8H9_9BURK
MNVRDPETLLNRTGEYGDGLALPPVARVQRRARAVGLAVLLLLLGGAAHTAFNHHEDARRLADTTAQNTRQYVNVVKPSATANTVSILLPGTLQGYAESPIYARARGYLLRWHADIGTPVQAGQLLAELDTPEIDHEFAQAAAMREQSAAALGLAKSSLLRWQQLRKRDAVSQQELDERESAYRQSVANLAAADANVERLRQLESFKRIVAPFAGIVTRRNVDIGNLVEAGSGGAGQALFVLTQSDRLRVYVNVPQAYAAGIAVGQQVTVTQAELAKRSFAGTVVHSAAAIDVATRSLKIEVALPNRDGALLPGAYVQVALPKAAQARLEVPGNTLLFRAEGPRIAIVDASGNVHLRPVVIAHDLGQALEIESGIAPGDQLIVNPSDSLTDGDKVLIRKTPAKAAT